MAPDELTQRLSAAVPAGSLEQFAATLSALRAAGHATARTTRDTAAPRERTR